MTELPQRLKDAQDEIAEFHKADALQKLIGKFYTKHEGTGYPTHLRRIYLDENEKVRVDDYHSPKGCMEFHFKSYTINEAVDLQNYDFRDGSEPKVWYDCLDRFLNSKPLNSLVVTRQGKVIENLKTSFRESEKIASKISDDRCKLENKIYDVKSAYSNQSWSKVSDKALLENIKKILGIEKNE